MKLTDGDRSQPSLLIYKQPRVAIGKWVLCLLHRFARVDPSPRRPRPDPTNVLENINTLYQILNPLPPDLLTPAHLWGSLAKLICPHLNFYLQRKRRSMSAERCSCFCSYSYSCSCEEKVQKSVPRDVACLQSFMLCLYQMHLNMKEVCYFLQRKCRSISA